MVKFLTIVALFWLIISPISGQVSDVEHFQSPLNIPLFLSGNFGELRTTHFHAGLDFKTQTVIGHPVYASSDGFVSRIKVQSGGYGQSIYLEHPGGYTTVYAHLDRYIPLIQEYVKRNQYAARSYEVDITVPKNKFSVRAGELIGYSGNTGRSGGPHLHFEIRRTEGQIPLNGLRYRFPVADDLPPVFRSLFAYAYRNHEPNAIQYERLAINSLQRKNDSVYQIEKEIEIDASYLGFGVEIYDFLNGSANKCGIYKMNIFIDGQACYGFTIDAISFGLTRFINAHMDYDLKINNSKSVHRLFSLPYNELPIYTTIGDNGIFALSDFDSHEARIVAEDAYGNTSTLLFSFRRKGDNLFDFSVPDLNYLVEWRMGRKFEEEGLIIDIPPRALYQDINFNYALIRDGKNIFADTLMIHSDVEPLHREISIQYPCSTISDSLRSKLLFALVNGGGKLSASGGSYSGGVLSMKTRTFGKYVLALDTLAPVIEYKAYSKGDQRFTFVVTDDLSGIASYNGFVDDQWALFTFDSKSGTLQYTIDPERITRGGPHELRLVVWDAVGNTSSYKRNFNY